VDTDSEQMQIQSEHTQNFVLQVLLPHIPSPQEGNPHPKWKKEREKKKQVLLLFALPHWVTEKYLAH